MFGLIIASFVAGIGYEVGRKVMKENNLHTLNELSDYFQNKYDFK